MYKVPSFTDGYDDDDDMVKKPLDNPTDDPDKELSDSRRATLRSPAKFGLFRNGGKQR